MFNHIMKYKFPPPMQMAGVSLTGSKLEISLPAVHMNFMNMKGSGRRALYLGPVCVCTNQSQLYLLFGGDGQGKTK